jgi:hypothetical protein
MLVRSKNLDRDVKKQMKLTVMHTVAHTVGATGSMGGRAEEGACAVRDENIADSIKANNSGYIVVKLLSDNGRLLNKCLLGHGALILSEKTTESLAIFTREASNVVV